MTLREGACLNRQSTVIWGVCSNRHITFIATKKLNLIVYFALYTVYVGEGLAENVRIPSYGRRGSKIAKKAVM